MNARHKHFHTAEIALTPVLRTMTSPPHTIKCVVPKFERPSSMSCPTLSVDVRALSPLTAVHRCSQARTRTLVPQLASDWGAVM